MDMIHLRNTGFAGCHFIGVVDNPITNSEQEIFDIGSDKLFGLKSEMVGTQVFPYERSNHHARSMISDYLQRKSQGLIRKTLKRRAQPSEGSPAGEERRERKKFKKRLHRR